MITFEFDEKKSQINLDKHGIDFANAQKLWGDPDLLEVPAKTVDEPRAIVIGMIAGKHWSGVITYRGKNIRIISVRRSRKEEVALYES
ncbi:MAG: BrnT family toxin [Chromatiales bacterium]|nr:BrnT family toxin [Gammaproteobacteria bacterium]